MNNGFIISIIVLILMGVGLSRVKYEVVFLKKTLKTLNADIEESMDNIKVLNAEWSFLNSPKRLKKLASKYLPDMKPIGIDQVMVYNKIIDSDLVVDEKQQKVSDTSLDSLLDHVVGRG